MNEKISGVVASDGKTLRRSHDRARGKKALHLVSAWASEARLVLGQVAIDEKSNEITAIPELLELLLMEGCIVSIDAMGTQRALATQIIEQKGDYVLALKENQGSLYEHVEDSFRLAQQEQFRDVVSQFEQTVEKAHGRLEIRKHWIIDDLEHKTRYYLLSFGGDVHRFASSVRSHWGIECSTSPFAKMSYAFAAGMPITISPSCVIWPSICCDKRRLLTSASRPSGSKRAGASSISYKF